MSRVHDDEPATIVERPSSREGAASRTSTPRAPSEVPPPSGETTLPGPRLSVAGVIGVGGMGIVYRAEQTELGRPIAFKRLIDAPTDEMRARFVREARLTAQLDHPNIVPVHLLDPGSTEAQSGYAMKLVEGKTLAALLAEAREAVRAGRPLDDDHALEARLEIFLKICDAIAFAHDRGIIHRDLKPQNVMIGAFGAVYVMDWGVARPIGEAELEGLAGEPGGGALTRVGTLIGSVPYMSPEQARGQNTELDARSDQYSLGLLLQEVVTLEPAIRGDTELVELELATAGQRRPIDASVPRELRAIIGRATAFERTQRYASTDALADDVRRFLRGEAVHALPEGPLARLMRFASRHRRATLIAFVGVIVLAALAITWTRYRQAANELALRERGARSTELYGEVARQASRIDRELFRMEEALEGLSTAAEWALQGPEPAADAAPVYFDTDFLDPAKRPADFTKQTAYRWPVSLEHPVVGVAPRVDRAALLSKIRRIVPLRTHMRELVIAAALGDERSLPPDEQRAFLAGRKSPIDYVYVDLAEGIHIMWPGVDALPPGYDVRTSSFYTMSERKRGKRWGAPYADSTTDTAGDDLVLPCTQGLWSATGEFLGVAGVEMTVTKMVETSMVLPGRTTLRTSLVNGEGRVVIDSRDANKRFVTTGKDEAVAFADLELPDIAAAIRAGTEGLRETRRDGQPIVVAFVRLDAIGWYYVVETDATTLGARR